MDWHDRKPRPLQAIPGHTGPLRYPVAAIVAAAVLVVAIMVPSGRAPGATGTRDDVVTIDGGPGLLSGIAWLDGGPILVVGNDGQIMTVDLVAKTFAPAISKGPHDSRVRVLMGRAGRELLTADVDGKAILWTEASQPIGSANLLAATNLSAPVPLIGPSRSVVFGADGSLYRWDLADALIGEPKPFANDLDKNPGSLWVVPKMSSKPRVAWVAKDGRRVRLYSAEKADAGKSAKGFVRAPEPVVAIAPTSDGTAFDAVAPSGVTRRFRFPEDLTPPAIVSSKFPVETVAQSLTPLDKAGHLVAADKNGTAYLLEIAAGSDTAPTASGNPIHDMSEPTRKAIAIASDRAGKRVVALLSEKDGTAGQLNRVLNLAAFPAGAWHEDTTALKAARAGSLAVSDDGTAVAVVATTGGGDPTLFRIDLATGMAPAPIPPLTMGALAFTYDATKVVTFLPGSNKDWLLLTRDSDTSGTLRLVSFDGMTTTTTPIANVLAGADLAAPPATMPIDGGAFLIASAWSDGKIRAHSLKGTTVTPLGEADMSMLGKVCSLALSKTNGMPRLAALSIAKLPKRTQTLSLFDPIASMLELERFRPGGDAPDGVPPLAWRGDDIAVATLDVSKKLGIAPFTPAFVSSLPQPSSDFPKVSKTPIIQTATATAVLNLEGRVLAALGDAPAKAVVIVELGPTPKPVASFASPTGFSALELLSEADVALINDAGAVVVYRSDGALPRTFNALPAWSPAGSAKTASIRRIDGLNLLASLDSKDRVMIKLPDPGGSGMLTAGQPRQVPGIEPPAILNGMPAPWAVGFEEPALSPRIRARFAGSDNLQLTRAFPVPSAPAGASKTITAAAWAAHASSLRDSPVLGLADGRLWVPDPDPRHPELSKSYEAPKGLKQGTLVRALAHHPDIPLVALAWTLDGNNVRLRDRNALGIELAETPLDAGAPATALAFSPDGAWLAAGTFAGGVRLWSVDTNGAVPKLTSVQDLNLSNRSVEWLAFGPDTANPKLAAVDCRGRVRSWSATGPIAAPFAIPVTTELEKDANDRTYRLAWSPDAKFLAVASQKGTVFVVPAP
jgi:WD domain, G-beta repeat